MGASDAYGATMSDAIVAGNFFNDLHECPELSGAVTGLHTAYDLLQRAALAEPTLPRLARLADELLKIHSELWMMRHVVLLNDEAASEAALIDWCRKVAAAHPKPAPNLSTATAGGCN